MLTTSEAAWELGILPATVHRAIREGRLPFTVKYGRKLISRSDLEAYKRRTRPDGEKPRGRPKGSRGIRTDDRQ